MLPTCTRFADTGLTCLAIDGPGPPTSAVVLQLVLAPIKGSPADRAGIKPGDILMQINGQDTNGWTGEEAAHHLRGQGGTQVGIENQCQLPVHK